jgi:hypothetical protein
MNIKMTKSEALKIQAEHIAWYESKYAPGNLAEVVAGMTTADQLEDGVEYPIITINQHIPRGGSIEHLCGISQPED